MNNIKNIKWGYGIIVALVFSLSGCYIDGPSAQERSYSTGSVKAKAHTDSHNENVATEAKATQKSYSSKEPTQKATPGPKRAAAPQLPVIQ